MPLRGLAKPLFSLDDREFRIVILSARYFFPVTLPLLHFAPHKRNNGYFRKRRRSALPIFKHHDHFTIAGYLFRRRVNTMGNSFKEENQ